MTWQHDKAWEEAYHNQVKAILEAYMAKLAILSFTSVTSEADRKYGTDLEVKVEGGTIAVRLRRAHYDYRDLTIRSRRASGMKTELAKIKEGYAYRYFYGWTDMRRTIAEWILVDLDRVRQAGLLDVPREEKSNRDGTFFIAIPIGELQEAGALVASLVASNVRDM